ncbi:MAG: hypothetical protein M3R38_14215 [Actinomycetota bacterium]|nr:hypothetical protein [Actinomycetota bacterium]
MNAEQIMDVRRRVYGEVNEAREELGELEARVGAIWADAARFTIDARGLSDSFVFRDEWAAVERELAMSRDPEELEALSSRDDLDEVYAYLDNVERVVRAGLLTMEADVDRRPGPPGRRHRSRHRGDKRL